jgi:aminoglycoside phosphotransferase (APT) family kinase protein
MERAGSRRIDWEDIPERVRVAIEERLGGPVVEARTQSGGFSPGLAARLRIADGSRAFVKAISPELNPVAPRIFRQEARIASVLPHDAPVSRLLWTYDEGEDGWVALAFADVEGHLPAIPWRLDELERVVAAIAAMHEALTPCPLDVPAIGARIAVGLRGWNRLTGEEEELDAWSRRHLPALQALEEAAPEAASGETMLHVDLRADNILLTQDGVVIVDWPGASVGAPWVDVLGMAPSVVLEGGPDAATFFAMHPAAQIAAPDRVDAVLAAFAGYFIYHSLQPHPPGLPTLRAFQAAQGEVACAWLAQRCGLE